jgi:hypothetical protein
VLVRQIRPVGSALFGFEGGLAEGAGGVFAGEDCKIFVWLVVDTFVMRWHDVSRMSINWIGLTLVRALRAVSFVARDVEDGAFDGDVGRVVGVGACGLGRQVGLVEWK